MKISVRLEYLLKSTDKTVLQLRAINDKELYAIGFGKKSIAELRNLDINEIIKEAQKESEYIVFELNIEKEIISELEQDFIVKRITGGVMSNSEQIINGMLMKLKQGEKSITISKK